jgi:hypothetical protein
MPRGMREQKHSSRIRQADVIASMLSELSAENIRKCPSLVLIFPFIFVQSAEKKQSILNSVEFCFSSLDVV